MKLLNRLLVLVLLILPSGAKAELFNFSYNFGDGSAVTGSFSGSLNGPLVQGITDVSVALNGIAFPGALTSVGFDPSGGFSTSTPAVASFDAASSNFMFVDAAWPMSMLNYFYLANSPGVFSEAHVVFDAGALAATDYPLLAANWSLTAVSAIPEPALYAPLLAGLLLVGLVVARRKPFRRTRRATNPSIARPHSRSA